MNHRCCKGRTIAIVFEIEAKGSPQEEEKVELRNLRYADGTWMRLIICPDSLILSIYMSS